MADDFIRQMESFANLRQAGRNATEGNHPVVASVSGLRRLVSPNAVPGFVHAEVINTLNGQSWRAHPHVGEEGREGRAPSLADRDPPGSVPLVLWVTEVMASLNHASPLAELARSSHTVRSVPRFSLASAGLSFTISEIVVPDDALYSTDAPAQTAIASSGFVLPVVPARLGIGDDIPASKLEADERLCGRHNGGRSLFCLAAASGGNRMSAATSP